MKGMNMTAKMPQAVAIGFRALAGDGTDGLEWNKENCRCDPGSLEQPPFHCEYCALHSALHAVNDAAAPAAASAQKCCGDFDSLVDAPECRECPARKHYIDSSAPPAAPASAPVPVSELVQLVGWIERAPLLDVKWKDIVEAIKLPDGTPLYLLTSPVVGKQSEVVNNLRELAENPSEFESKDIRKLALEAASAIECRGEAVAQERRYIWAVNELLACDYGDNEYGRVGWRVYGWRDRTVERRIYGDSIRDAIDNFLAENPKMVAKLDKAIAENPDAHPAHVEGGK